MVELMKASGRRALGMSTGYLSGERKTNWCEWRPCVERTCTGPETGGQPPSRDTLGEGDVMSAAGLAVSAVRARWLGFGEFGAKRAGPNGGTATVDARFANAGCRSRHVGLR